jgi:hypothetical protein
VRAWLARLWRRLCGERRYTHSDDVLCVDRAGRVVRHERTGTVITRSGGGTFTREEVEILARAWKRAVRR